jgi:hypothetical protein
MQIRVRVIPKAKLNKVEKLSASEYKIWLTTAPTDGKANQALIKELAKFLGIKKAQLEIKSGFTSRDKVLEADI